MVGVFERAGKNDGALHADSGADGEIAAAAGACPIIDSRIARRFAVNRARKPVKTGQARHAL
jgi:hypothetical protein